MDAMTQALDLFLGCHDFASFEGAGSPRSSSVRKIVAATLERKNNGRLLVTLQANGFLRHMVRNILGTLVDEGMSTTDPQEINKIIAAKDRSQAGITAPAQSIVQEIITDYSTRL